MPMLSSTSTLRFRKARRHFRPTRWHSATVADDGPWRRRAVETDAAAVHDVIQSLITTAAAGASAP